MLQSSLSVKPMKLLELRKATPLFTSMKWYQLEFFKANSSRHLFLPPVCSTFYFLILREWKLLVFLHWPCLLMKSGALPPSRRACGIWPFNIFFPLWPFIVKSRNFRLHWIYLKKVQMIKSVIFKTLYVLTGFLTSKFVSNGVTHFPWWPWTPWIEKNDLELLILLC